MDFFSRLFNAPNGLAPLPFALTVVSILVFWFILRPSKPVWEWIAPKSAWTDRSTRVDIILLILNRLIGATGLATRLTLVPVIAALVAGILPFDVVGPSAPVWVLAATYFLAYDFTAYWVHRLFHSQSFLWPLHAVHHSATVMTPLTAQRQHPLGIFVSAALSSVIMGSVLGVLVGSLAPESTFYEIAGINAVWFVVFLVISNLHHSHMWISYGPVLERLFISPAQHQVHHSINPQHYNRNYGVVLAVWDWMFGTLYIVRRDEEIVFGLDGSEDAPIMTQRIGPMLIDPVKRMFSMS